MASLSWRLSNMAYIVALLLDVKIYFWHGLNTCDDALVGLCSTTSGQHFFYVFAWIHHKTPETSCFHLTLIFNKCRCSPKITSSKFVLHAEVKTRGTDLHIWLEFDNNKWVLVYYLIHFFLIVIFKVNFCIYSFIILKV